MQYGINHTYDLRHFGDVVDANDVCATHDTRCNRTRRAPGALVLWRSAKRFADKTLSRGADEQRKTEACKLRQLLQQFEILRRALAEADAGIEHDLRFCN